MIWRLSIHPAAAPRYAALYDPSTLALTAVAASTASAGIAAVGAIRQGQAQAQAAQYQAQVARNNAIIANQNSEAAIAAGNSQAITSELRTAQLAGRQRAALAASGIDPNSGSALDIQRDTAETGALDALTIRNNAARQAYGYQVAGVSDNAQAQLDQSTAANDTSASYLNAGGSIIGGASSVSNQWLSYNQKGINLFGSTAPNTGATS